MSDTDWLADVIGQHIARDRYNEEGESVGTYCTARDWEGDYFADGEAGPFDAHLAAVIRAAMHERVKAVEGGGRPDAPHDVSEAIARVQWNRKVEEEAGNTSFEIDAPEFDDLGTHRDYLIRDARPLARAAVATIKAAL